MVRGAGHLDLQHVRRVAIQPNPTQNGGNLAQPFIAIRKR